MFFSQHIDKESAVGHLNKDARLFLSDAATMFCSGYQEQNWNFLCSKALNIIHHTTFPHLKNINNGPGKRAGRTIRKATRSEHRPAGDRRASTTTTTTTTKNEQARSRPTYNPHPSSPPLILHHPPSQSSRERACHVFPPTAHLQLQPLRVAGADAGVRGRGRGRHGGVRRHVVARVRHGAGGGGVRGVRGAAGGPGPAAGRGQEADTGAQGAAEDDPGRAGAGAGG